MYPRLYLCTCSMQRPPPPMSCWGVALVKSPHYDHSLSLSLTLDRLHESISRSPVYRPCAEVSPGARSYERTWVSKPTTAIQAVADTSSPRGWLLSDAWDYRLVSWQKPLAEYCGISWKCIVLLLIRRGGTRDATIPFIFREEFRFSVQFAKFTRSLSYKHIVGRC